MHAFNQLPDDHGLEHIDRIGKFAGGLVDITRSDAARDRWSLNIHVWLMILMSYIAKAAKVVMLTMVTRMLVRIEFLKDQNDVNSLCEQFQQFRVFDYISISSLPDNCIHAIITKSFDAVF